MDKEFYIEWLFVSTKYSREYFENMSLEQLEKEYSNLLGEGDK